MTEKAATPEDYGVLKDIHGGGPKGFGDPNTRNLRTMETDLIIPKRVRKVAKEVCQEDVKVFSACGQAAGLLSWVKCRKELRTMQECMAKVFNDPEVMNKCKEEYLKERSEFRQTGVPLEKYVRGSEKSQSC